MTDVHYADKDTSGDRYYRDSDDKMTDAVTAWNADENVDFVIELGDFINGDDTLGAAQLTHIDGVYDDLTADRYYVIGNHDVDDLSLAEFQAGSGMPETGLGYYSFTAGDLLGIVLDSNYGDIDGNNYGDEYSGWIHTTQLTWLTDTLAGAEQTEVAVFIHHRLYGDDMENYGVQNASTVRIILQNAVINNGQTIHVFQGHQHQEDKYLVNKVYYHGFEGMVTGSYAGGNNSFGIVKYYDNGWIEVDGTGNMTDYSVAVPRCI